MIHKYRLYRPDGSSQEIGEYKRELSFKTTAKRKGMYELLDCRTIEIIPRDYYPESDSQSENITYFGDEEARLIDEPERNRHMKVLFDHRGNQWDVVGSLIREEKVSEQTNKKTEEMDF